MRAARTRLVAATALLCWGALTACGAAEGPGSEGSAAATETAASATPTASTGQATAAAQTSPAAPGASSSASPSTAPAPIVQKVPKRPPSEPMTTQARTPDGATAFLEHYVAVLNWAHQAADARPVATFEGPDCAPCKVTRAAIDALAAKKQHSDANLLTLDGLAPPANTGASPYVVPATLTQNLTPILDAAGAEVGQYKAQSTKRSYVLQWTGLGWQVSDIR